MLRHWIELARVHTAGLTTALFVGGYLMAGGTVLSVQFLLWFLCGVFYHVSGFIHNNITDLPSDSVDPRKTHFPLVTRALDFRKVDEVDRYLMVLFCFFGLYLTNLQPIPTLLLLLAISGGFLYDYYSKQTTLAVFGVATAWGILPLISYSATVSQFSPVVLWITFYSWIQVFIQISVLGSVKDMEAPAENNWLRRLGCRVKGDFFECSMRGFIYVFLFKVFHLLLLFPVLLTAGSSTFAWILSIGLYGLSFLPYLLLMSVRWQRDKVLGRCVFHEAFCFLASIAAIQGTIGWDTTVFMLVYPVIWVFVWMRLQWGTWRTGPKV